MTPPDASADRELEALEQVLRTDPPHPTPAFAQAMDARVAGGFKQPRRSLGELFGGRLWIPSLATAATVAVAVAALAVAGVFGGGGGRSGTRVASAHVEHDAQVTLTGVHGGSVAKVARMEGGSVLTSSATSIQIEVPTDRLDAALAELERRGTVQTLSRTAAPLGAHSSNLRHRMHYSRITVRLAGGSG